MRQGLVRLGVAVLSIEPINSAAGRRVGGPLGDAVEAVVEKTGMILETGRGEVVDGNPDMAAVALGVPAACVTSSELPHAHSAGLQRAEGRPPVCAHGESKQSHTRGVAKDGNIAMTPALPLPMVVNVRGAGREAWRSARSLSCASVPRSGRLTRKARPCAFVRRLEVAG